MKTQKPPITEREFLAQIIALAHMHSWIVAHFRPARTSAGGRRTAVQGDGVGFPDLILLRGKRAIAAELKVGRGKPTPHQVVWLDAFRETSVETYIWRPADWDEIEEVLQ